VAYLWRFPTFEFPLDGQTSTPAYKFIVRPFHGPFLTRYLSYFYPYTFLSPSTLLVIAPPGSQSERAILLPPLPPSLLSILRAPVDRLKGSAPGPHFYAHLCTFLIFLPSVKPYSLRPSPLTALSQQNFSDPMSLPSHFFPCIILSPFQLSGQVSNSSRFTFCTPPPPPCAFARCLLWSTLTIYLPASLLKNHL